MGLFRRQPSNPRTEFDRALHAESLTLELPTATREEMYRNWVELRTECGVDARDFVRVLIGKQSRMDPTIIDAAARKITVARGIAPPEGRWETEQVDAHYKRFLQAIVSGARQSDVEALLEEMPAYPTNTAKFIMSLARDAARFGKGRGDLLSAAAQIGDPVLMETYRLIHLAADKKWPELATAAQTSCEAGGSRNQTGEFGGAIEGALVGLLYRDLSSNSME